MSDYRGGLSETLRLQWWEAQMKAQERPMSNDYPGGCPNCGSIDGMIAYDDYEFDLITPEEVEQSDWYVHVDDPNAIYRPCGQCPIDTDGFTPISDDEASDIIRGRWIECDCVLPSQSCPACRAAARIAHGGIPF